MENLKEKGVKNVSMPVLIPESLLNKEKDHVEGFAPEVAWVTMGGQEKIRRKIMYKTNIRDNIFFNVFKMVKFMERFTIFI